MDVIDPFLLKVLSFHPNLSESDYHVMESWWLMDRKGDETIVDFMIRQGVFSKDSARTIDLIRRGVLTYCDPKRIFGEQGHHRLREYAQQMGFKTQSLSPTTDPKTDLRSKLNSVKDWLARRAEAKQQNSIGNLPEVEHLRSESAPATLSVSFEPPPSTTVPRLSPVPDRASQVFSKSKFPQIGEQYGKYLLTEEVARGGTAVVFRALNRSLNSTVAIKVLKMDREEGLNQDQARMLESLRHEAQLLARFNHPNLVRVYDLDEEATFPFLVLEYVDGLSLYDILAHVGRLRVDRAIRIITSVVEGLSAAYRKMGLVHRDIKPGNILLAREGCVKLADLGLAMTTDTWTSNSSLNSSVLAGTAAYMAPEMCTSGEVDLRSDIYSLGATFYHAIVGEMPFKGKNRMEVMLKHTKEMPVPPHQVVSGLHSSASEVILKMMAKNPMDRFQDYEELLEELKRVQTGSAPELQLSMPIVTPVGSN